MAVTCTVSSSVHAFNLPRSSTLRSSTKKASSPTTRISRRPNNAGKQSLKASRITNPRIRVYNLPVRLPQPMLSSGSHGASLLSKDFLASMRSSLKRVTTNCPSVISTKDLGSSVTIDTRGANQFTDSRFLMPAFCFAAYDGTQEGESFLYPCHALPALALCPNIDRSQLSSAPPSSNSSEPSLPVVPLRLPDPKSFVLLRNYMYTRSQPDLLSNLLPASILHKPSSPTGDPAITSRALAASLTAPAVLRLAKKLHGVWGNVCTLGISDEELWTTLQFAWAVVIGAMRLMNARQVPHDPLYQK